MSHLEREQMVPGQRYRVKFQDDLTEGAFEATLLAIIESGEVDPLGPRDERDPTDKGEITWPSPRTYWDNGLVIDGGLMFEWVEVPR